MPEKYEYAYGAGKGGGLAGHMHGQIGSPLEQSPYTIEANGGGSQKGGEPAGPFGQYMETPNQMMGVGRDSMQGAPQGGFGSVGSGGGISTPMDTSTAMPGVRGSDGYGPTSGGGAKIAGPWSGPWGEMVG